MGGIHTATTVELRKPNHAVYQRAATNHSTTGRRKGEELADHCETRIESRRTKKREWDDKLSADIRHTEYIPVPIKCYTIAIGSANPNAKSTRNVRRTKTLCHAA